MNNFVGFSPEYAMKNFQATGHAVYLNIIKRKVEIPKVSQMKEIKFLFVVPNQLTIEMLSLKEVRMVNHWKRSLPYWELVGLSFNFRMKKRTAVNQCLPQYNRC